MNAPNMRVEAAKLAREFNAPKTLEIINDESKNSSMKDILHAAAEEVGLKKLVETILESDQPSWALGAIRYLDDIGPYEKALREKSGVTAMSSREPVLADVMANVDDTSALPSVNQLEMYVACGAGYAATATMWYYTPPFANVWKKSTEYTGSRPVCQSATLVCSEFSNPSSPLKTGDVVQLVVHPDTGVDNATGIFFVYNPSVPSTAEIDCHGTVRGTSFTWSVKPNS